MNPALAVLKLLLLLSMCQEWLRHAHAAPGAAHNHTSTNASPVLKSTNMQAAALNILGTALQTCNDRLQTGWYRDGTCRTDAADAGMHSVCAIVTDEFLQYSKSAGNNLITPAPQFRFPGLVAGDAWCVCAGRWLQAYRAGVTPPLQAAATEMSAVNTVPLEVLRAFETAEASTSTSTSTSTMGTVAPAAGAAASAGEL